MRKKLVTTALIGVLALLLVAGVGLAAGLGDITISMEDGWKITESFPIWTSDTTPKAPPTFKVSANASGFEEKDAITMTFYVDGDIIGTKTFNFISDNGTLEHVFSPSLSEGIYTAKVVVTGPGEHSATASQKFIVDYRAPVIRDPQPANKAVLTECIEELSVAIDDVMPAESLEVSLKVEGSPDPGTIAYDEASGRWVVTYGSPLSPGCYKLEVEAKDEIHDKVTKTFTFTIVDTNAYWKPTAGAGIHGSAVYQEYKLLDQDDSEVSLKNDAVSKITRVGPDGEKQLTPDDDATLWFNVLNEPGEYAYTVVNKTGEMYAATLKWQQPTAVVAKQIGPEGENGAEFEFVTTKGKKLESFDAVFRLYGNEAFELNDGFTVNDEGTFMFLTEDQDEGEHTFLIRSVEPESKWYVAIISYPESLDREAPTYIGEAPAYLGPNTDFMLSFKDNMAGFDDETELYAWVYNAKGEKVLPLEGAQSLPVPVLVKEDSTLGYAEWTEIGIAMRETPGIKDGETFTVKGLAFDKFNNPQEWLDDDAEDIEEAAVELFTAIWDSTPPIVTAPEDGAYDVARNKLYFRLAESLSGVDLDTLELTIASTTDESPLKYSVKDEEILSATTSRVTVDLSSLYRSEVLKNGEGYQLTLAVSDNAGNRSSEEKASTDIIVTVSDTEDPIVTLVEPANGNWDGVSAITVRATDISGVAEVRMGIQGFSGMISASNEEGNLWTITLDDLGGEAFAEGIYTLIVYADDNAKPANTYMSTIKLTVGSEEPPVIDTTAPEVSVEVSAGVVIATVADDTALDRVELYIDGEKVVTKPVSGTQAVAEFDLPDRTGIFEVQVKVYDTAGNSATSKPIIVTIRPEYKPGTGDGFGWEMWK